MVTDSNSETTSIFARPWIQLVLGIVCMASVANLQYGWTLFVDPIDAQFHWGRAAIQVAFTIFVLIEAGVGFVSHSLALMADAGHNLSDVLALLLAWGAAALARRAPAGRRTYGLRKATILASLANAVLLLVAVGAIASESVHRLLQPAAVNTSLVMLAALRAGFGVAACTIAKNRQIFAVVLRERVGAQRRECESDGHSANGALHRGLRTRLAELGVQSEAYAFASGSPESLRYAIDPKWLGEKPRAYLYAANGTRTAQSGVISSADLAIR